ncbi:hypothetical protein [Oleiharenicola sp. Vm1]|uniref:hypothetical protein n=1 Tax=Oleiharenicola sp. Vm1 TaxID=3398393 RepID=UPI0039F5DE1C
MKISVKLNSAWRRDLPPGDRRLWLLRAVALRFDRGMKVTCTCEILWKRLLALLAAAALALYLLAATALFLWWDRVPGNQVTWLDVVTLPVRAGHVRQKRGDSAIAAALERLREKDAVEAFYGLRAGLVRSPANAAGRVALARLMLGSDPRGALALLEDGLAYSPGDPELLRALFSVYAAQQARARALETTARLLSAAQSPALDAAARDWVRDTRAALLLTARNPAEAEAALAVLPPDAAGPEGERARRLRLSACVQLGRLDEARRLLATLPGTSADDFRSQAEVAIAAGDAAALDSALTRLKAAAPGQPAPLIFAFNAWHQMKRLSYRDRTEAEFFRFFGGNDAALQLFAAAAVNLELPDVLRRTEQIALASRLSPFAFRVHLTELALRRGDVDEAFRRLREWEPTIETLAPAQRYYPEFVRRLVRASVPGGEQQSAGLVNHLGDLRGRATVGMYELAGKVLARAGNFAGARDVVQLGLRHYPHSDPLLRLAPDLAAAADQQAAAKTPSAADPALPAVTVPPTAAAALAQLDAALADEAFGTAGDLLRAIRAARPAWFDRAAGDLARRETELAVLAQDPATARARVHGYLERPRPDADLLALVQFAQRLSQRGRVAEARLLRDELAAVRPSGPVAAAWQRLELPDDLAAIAATAATALAEIERSLRQNRADDALRLIEHVRQKSPPGSRSPAPTSARRKFVCASRSTSGRGRSWP